MVILGPGVNFGVWKLDLQMELVRCGLIGHVFHDIGIPPKPKPTAPARTEGQTESAFIQLQEDYEIKLERWTEGEIIAKEVIMRRVAFADTLQNFWTATAKELYDGIAASRKEVPSIQYEDAIRALLRTKVTTSTDDYCKEFNTNLISVNNAASALVTSGVGQDECVNSYAVPEGLASVLFALGTEEVPWLEIWRQTRVTSADNSYMSLQTMMTSIRRVRERPELSGPVTSVVRHSNNRLAHNTIEYEDERCQLCKHNHLNRDCYKQHPGIAPTSWNPIRRG